MAFLKCDDSTRTRIAQSISSYSSTLVTPKNHSILLELFFCQTLNQQEFQDKKPRVIQIFVIRALAASLCGLFARIGALVGNSLFGYLIDDYCVPLIAIIAGQLIGKFNDG